MSDRDSKVKAPPSPYLFMDTDLLRELLKLPISWDAQIEILRVVQERAVARVMALAPRNDHRRPKRS